ncbi:hypothetical protein RhiirB3_441757 [Rhizophagus irregularis]|nr:hypothetical protein RhiirB3_441757 [Rhizophagus irregularis]
MPMKTSTICYIHESTECLMQEYTVKEVMVVALMQFLLKDFGVVWDFYKQMLQLIVYILVTIQFMTDEETKYLIDQRMFRNEVFWGLSSKLNENTLDLLIGIATFEEMNSLPKLNILNLYDDNPTITLPNTLTTSKIYIPIIKIISNTIIITTDDDEILDDYYPISIDDDTKILKVNTQKAGRFCIYINVNNDIGLYPNTDKKQAFIKSNFRNINQRISYLLYLK